MSGKILFFGRLSTPLFNKSDNSSHGGAEVQLYNLSKQLSLKGKKIVFVLGGKGPESCGDIDLEYISKHNNLRSMSWNFFRILDIFKTHKPNYVLFRSALFENIFFVLFSYILGIKTIFMIAHDRQVKFGHHKGFIFDIVNKFLLFFSNIVVCQNSYQISKLTSFKSKSFLVRSIHIRPNVKENVSKKSIIWIGRNVAWKRLEVVEKLASIFPNINFTVLGVNKASNLDNLSFKGFVKFDETWQHITNSDFLINTSVSEGFPNTFIQAWMCSKPVVSLNVNPDNLIDKYRAGFCAKGNIKLFTSMIYYLSNNRELLSHKQVNCKKLVHDLFEFNTNVSRFESLL